MEILQETPSVKKTFFNHVFSMSEESNAEVLNVLQYAFTALVPVFVLNKSILDNIKPPDENESKSIFHYIVRKMFDLKCNIFSYFNSLQFCIWPLKSIGSIVEIS